MIIYDIEDGNDIDAMSSFIALLKNYIPEGRDVTITVGGIQFKAYDHTALIQGLIDAIEYFQSEL